MKILDLVCVHEDAEEMLQFARQIYKGKSCSKSMAYIIKISRKLAEEQRSKLDGREAVPED